MLGIVKGSGDPAVNKTDQNPDIMEHTCEWKN